MKTPCRKSCPANLFQVFGIFCASRLSGVITLKRPYLSYITGSTASTLEKSLQDIMVQESLASVKFELWPLRQG